jgi:hypothetical protein
MRKRPAVIVLTILSSVAAFAATSTINHDVTLSIPEVVLIGLNNGGVITLTVVAPGTAGNPPTGQTNASKWLNYSTCNATGTNRIITVNWGGTDAAPAGTSLRVQATSVTAGCGTAGAAVTISAVAQNIVTAIPSCVTGTGANGANLTYTLVVATPASLRSGDNHLVTVTYTITAAS